MVCFLESEVGEMLRGLEDYEVQARPSRNLGDGLDDKKSGGIENERK